MLTGIPNRKKENKTENKPETGTENTKPADTAVTAEEIDEQALKRYLEASSEQKRKVSPQNGEIMMTARKESIDRRDQMAMRRVLNKSDLMPISYLQTGLRVSESVCRILLKDGAGSVRGYGSGFLVSPEIMITNNHVIPDIETAAATVAEFNYQDDENFNTGPVHAFGMNPKRFFMTDRELDFTLVSLNPKSDSGKKLKDIPHLELNPKKATILEEEYVSIIQHPGKEKKAVTLRENEVKYLLDDFIQYAADTKNGSSGSPVFNDQWAVVAVHHASVRDPNRKTVWIANEGVRISSIANFVKKEYEKADAKTQTVMEGIFMELKESDKKKKYQLKADQYRDGYDPLFLGEDYRIDLPGLSAKMEEDSTRTKDGGNVLDYVHFSIIMRRSRGLAYFTAVNIDGKSAKDIKRKNDKWSFDSRIPRIHQYGEEVYAKNDLDRGHLVRRLDPVWGEYKTASQANNDTFYFTNSAPQHKNLNQKTWLGLENYLLNNAQNHGLRISVFTGPVFKDEDMKYREKYLIPDEFWKIVAMVKKDGALSVTAYIQSQQDYLSELEEFVYGPYQTYQVPVALIEELTGLDFGELYKSDPMEAYESTGLLISELTNIIL